MSPAQREQIKLALGRDVLSVAQEIQFCLNTYGKADAALWRRFLEALHKSAGDEVMNSPLGLTIQMAILGRIQNGNDGASEPRRKPSGGFPGSGRREW
jgi:hypothetical protein